MQNSIMESARIENSTLGDRIKVFREAEVINSSLGDYSIVGDHAVVLDSEVESNVSINRRNYILRSKIGRFSYTGIGTTIRSAHVGRFCSISWNVSIGGANHDYTCASTSSLQRFFSLDTGNINHKDNKALQKRFETLEPCVIGNDVWIATNAVVLNGVSVGNGSVIGAGAIVTKDVEPYSIIAGVPAKPIKKRFDGDTIATLQEIAWWDWPVEVIRENLNLIYSEKVNDQVLDELLAVSKEVRNDSN